MKLKRRRRNSAKRKQSGFLREKGESFGSERRKD
jgi:hypothetical protein